MASKPVRLIVNRDDEKLPNGRIKVVFGKGFAYGLMKLKHSEAVIGARKTRRFA